MEFIVTVQYSLTYWIMGFWGFAARCNLLFLALRLAELELNWQNP